MIDLILVGTNKPRPLYGPYGTSKLPVLRGLLVILKFTISIDGRRLLIDFVEFIERLLEI